MGRSTWAAFEVHHLLGFILKEKGQGLVPNPQRAPHLFTKEERSAGKERLEQVSETPARARSAAPRQEVELRGSSPEAAICRPRVRGGPWRIWAKPGKIPGLSQTLWPGVPSDFTGCVSLTKAEVNVGLNFEASFKNSLNNKVAFYCSSNKEDRLVWPPTLRRFS